MAWKCLERKLLERMLENAAFNYNYHGQILNWPLFESKTGLRMLVLFTELVHGLLKCYLCNMYNNVSVELYSANTKCTFIIVRAVIL